MLEIGNRAGKIAKAQIAFRAVIKCVPRIAACRDGLVKGLERLRVLLLFQAELAQFLVIPSGRIVDDLYFQSLYARSAPESLEYAAQESRVRQHLTYDVCAGSQESSEENDVQPIVVRTPSHKVHQCDDLHQKAPGIKELSKSEHGRPRS